MDKYLDLGSGSCLLAKRPIAQIVVDSLIHLEETSLDLFSWVIMPNHVHMLIKPKNGTELSSLMHSLKSYTAHEANKTLGRKGKFWMREYFDRFIRDHEHFVRTVNYIENNPVKARLCRERNGWEFSSAYGMTDEEIYARLF